MKKLQTFEQFMVQPEVMKNQRPAYFDEYMKLGELNESHTYFNNVCSVLYKVDSYSIRRNKIYRSNINESLKAKLDKDVLFNESEKIGVNVIFSEMLRHYEMSMNEEIAYYDKIISGDEQTINEALSMALADNDELLLEWGLPKWLSKPAEKIKDSTKKFVDKSKEELKKGYGKLKDTYSDAKEWAKELKKQCIDRYVALAALVEEISKKAGNSVKEFVKAIFESFEKIAEESDGLFSKVIDKLGGIKMDSGEKIIKPEVKDIDAFKGIDDEGEKCFVSYLISESIDKWNIYTKSHSEFDEKKNVDESLVVVDESDEKSENSKFKEWLRNLGTRLKDINVWKSILVSLSVSIFMWVLPHILIGVVGLSCPIAMFIVAFVNFCWSWRNFFKFVRTRRKAMKSEGESGIKGFFKDKKTTIFFILAVLSVTLSTFNLGHTFGPFMAQICKNLGLNGDSEGIGKVIYDIMKKVNPEDVVQAGEAQRIQEEISKGTDSRSNDLAQSQKDLIDNLRDNNQVTDAQTNAEQNFMDAIRHAKKGSTEVYKAAEAAAQSNPDMLRTHLYDTSKWGGSDPIKQALDFFKDSGDVPQGASMATFGSEATQAASHGQYGFMSGIVGVSDEQAHMIFAKAAEIAGQDASQLQIHSYGSTLIAPPGEIVIPGIPQINVPTPEMLFQPMFIPFFDKAIDGKFKMRFSSATRAFPAYVVSTKDTKMVDGEELKKIADDTPAVDKLMNIHDNAWKESDKLNNKSEDVSESKKNKKEDKKKEKKIEEPGYVVLYVNRKVKTGNKKDIERKKDNENNIKETLEPAIVIDTLTLMCADICKFNKNRRPQPYYMKGLLSRLSFRPTKNKDNDTKDLIREILGKTMQTSVAQSAKFGLGQKYVKIDNSDKKNPKYVVADDVNASQNVTEIGNLSPKEMVDCLNDKTRNNKSCYDLLDGRFATKLNIKTDDNGNIKITAKKDSSSIEFIKYYKVSDEEKEHLTKKYEENLKKYNDGNKKTKPSKPRFKTVTIDGEEITYKQLSAATKKRLNLSDDEIYDFVDLKITPMLDDEKSKVYKELNDDENIKKILYKDDKLNKEVIKVLKPFLFRPEKTFSKNDEYALNQIIKKDKDGFGSKLKRLFTKLEWSDEEVHDTFKNIVEIIWDELIDKNRDNLGDMADNTFDTHRGNKKTNESMTTLYDKLVEEYLDNTLDYDNDNYDEYICEYREHKNDISSGAYIMTRDEFLVECYKK